jgi:hypothetical protein
LFNFQTQIFFGRLSLIEQGFACAPRTGLFDDGQKDRNPDIETESYPSFCCDVANALT